MGDSVLFYLKIQFKNNIIIEPIIQQGYNKT